MWILSKHPSTKIEEDIIEYYLLTGREYVVGRKECDIVISGDISISRKHASFSVSALKKGTSQQTDLQLTDSSKTGTTINGAKIAPKIQTSIKDGDIISFGKVMQNKFRLSHRNIGVVMSCVKATESKNKILNLVQKLGGECQSNWSDNITHLVMEKVTFTIKVVCALASGKPIVSLKYFEDVLDCCDQKKGKRIPLEINYLPEIDEANLMYKECLLQPNVQRKNLLVGKMFIALIKKQYKQLQQAIQLSGGTILLKDTKDMKLFEQLSSNQTLVLHVEKRDEANASNEEKAWFSKVYAKVKSANLRSIKESEVGLAILHNSLQTYCNPTLKNFPSSQMIHDTQTDTQQTQQSQLQHPQLMTFKKPSTPVKINSQKINKTETIHSTNSTKDESLTTTLPIVEETQFTSSRKRPLSVDLTASIPDSKQKKSKIASENFCAAVIESSIKEESFDEEINSMLEDEFEFEDPLRNVEVTEHSVHNLSVQHTLEDDGTLLDQSKRSKRTSKANSIFVNDTLLSTAKTNFISPTSCNPVVSDTFASSTRSHRKTPAVPDTFASSTRSHRKTPAVPDTFASSTRSHRKTPVVSDTFASSTRSRHKTLVDDSNPFDFDMDEFSPPNAGLDGMITNIISDSQGNTPASLQINNVTTDINNMKDEQDESRYLKAAGSSQDSEVFDMASSVKQENISVISNPTPQVASHPTPAVMFDITKQSDKTNDDLMASMLQDDIIPSEEFLPKKLLRPKISSNGFISVEHKVSTVIKPKDDPDLTDIPRGDLIQTECVSLVTNNANHFKNNQSKSFVSKRKVKNFKCFKKQRYAGSTRKIGKNDLVIFESDNVERACLFDEFREELDREEDDNKRADKLFNWESQ